MKHNYKCIQFFYSEIYWKMTDYQQHQPKTITREWERNEINVEKKRTHTKPRTGVGCDVNFNWIELVRSRNHLNNVLIFINMNKAKWMYYHVTSRTHCSYIHVNRDSSVINSLLNSTISKHLVMRLCLNHVCYFMFYLLTIKKKQFIIYSIWFENVSSFYFHTYKSQRNRIKTFYFHFISTVLFSQRRIYEQHGID